MTPIAKGRAQVLAVGSAVWALVGALVALSAVPKSTPDARWLVALASVIFPAAAAAAAVALRRGAIRWGGVLLLVLAPSTVAVEPAPRHS